MMGRTGLTGVPSGGDDWTLVVSLAREKIDISAILPLIKYEILNETECLDAVSQLAEDVSMHSSVHIYCYANKCASNAFPLLLFFSEPLPNITIKFFSVLTDSLRVSKL